MDQTEDAYKGRSIVSGRVALRFVILLGLVSLLADMTYEGARSINGPFLAILGASSVAVAMVAGLGELVGFSLRLVSGYISDKTRRFWAITFSGYAINLIAVPLLALAGSWQAAVLLMIIERVGKGIRVPPRDAMLSYATQQMGRGWGFGLHEAMDQVGAILGPLIVATVFYFQGGYQTAYGILLIPALFALAVLAIASFLYPHPQELEIPQTRIETRGFSRIFWLYVAAAALIAAGFADFPLIAFHFQKSALADTTLIPVLYAIAMGVDALAAITFGRLYDRIGLTTMVIVVLISVLFAPLVFIGGLYAAVLGMVLWGIGMGAQESIMRAAVGGLVSAERRSRAYGVFNAIYGLAWFLGSLLIGVLYNVSIPALVVFSMAVQLASIPIFFRLRKEI